MGDEPALSVPKPSAILTFPESTSTVPFRFASTRFPHGQLLTIRLQAKVTPVIANDGTIVEAGQPVILEPAVKPLPWNNCQRLATRWIVVPNQVVSDDDPLTVPGSAKATVTAAGNRFAGSQGMNHNVFPTVSASQNYGRASFLADLESATVVVVDSHGAPSSFEDSADARQGMIFTGTWAPGYLQPHATIVDPYVNLALIYACQTIPSQADKSNAIVGFGLDRQGRDQAYSGFELIMHCCVNPKSSATYTPTSALKVSLSEHAKVVCDNLKKGATISAALFAANAAFPPRGTEGPMIFDSKGNRLWKYAPMRCLGDPLTRMMNVYLTNDERLQHKEAIDRWYIFFQPTY